MFKFHLQGEVLIKLRLILIPMFLFDKEEFWFKQ